MNLQELSRKYVEIDVKAMEDVLNFIRRRQKAEKLMDDDFDYSILYEYILKEQEYVKIKSKEKAIEKSKKAISKIIGEDNTVWDWLNDNPRIEDTEVRDAYMDYVYWTKLKGLEAVKSPEFVKAITMYGYKNVMGFDDDARTIRIYVKEE